MAEILEEFITLTPLTCVQQCNALLGSTSGKPRSCFVFFTLFGVYCGVLIFRAYRTYSSKQEGVEEKITEGVTLEAKAEDLNIGPGPSLVHGYVDQTKPILLQPVGFSSTDMRWRYCNDLPEAELAQGSDSENRVTEKDDIDDLERMSNVVDDNDVQKPVASTSMATARAPEDNADGEHVEPTPFSV
ncbi:uncharacterized protein LOC6733575 [Drosophila simulans]|uniref:GD10148 n=1 Tax=Drosophila simulans TaxID=7240 RepID=B4QG65_DROSI|nr:uncharacterized protein LOC6733575 [Drosophila simulans]EDX06215.1 GD10148 [Drosophila simulans]KMY92313.1 uncharacterized protein Dsimw501_GD10148 [Drosophila simulans]